MRATRQASLRRRLEGLASAYDVRFLDSDPVGLVRRYQRPEDLEIAGLLAAGLAYGRVSGIRASVDRVFAVLGARPRRFLESYDPARDGARFDGFAHRFTRGRDLALLLTLMQRAVAGAGSLEAFFVEGDPRPEAPTLEGAMDAFGRRLFALAPASVSDASGARWLLPLPRAGSVAKRHCLYLRWMVRPDDGVDLGAWPRVSPSRLVLPLDVHLQRVARALGWTRRRSPSWAMALEVTEHLRRLDPADPTRFDFALCRLGILGRMRARNGRVGRRAVLEAIDAIAPLEAPR
jgi:uncharacterized protein (TIGR02757 family)